MSEPVKLWAFYRHKNSREWGDAPFMWHDTTQYVSMYSFTVDAREYRALPAVEFATLTRERDEAVKDLTDVRWAFKCSVDAHEATRADLASARTALASAKSICERVRDFEPRLNGCSPTEYERWVDESLLNAIKVVDAALEPAP